jgi:hypothetical protein
VLEHATDPGIVEPNLERRRRDDGVGEPIDVGVLRSRSSDAGMRGFVQSVSDRFERVPKLSSCATCL